MSNELAGNRIAFLVANAGVEQVELTSPWQAVTDAGGEPVLLAPEKEPIKTVNRARRQLRARSRVRRDARAPHGFGDYLAGLNAETGAAPA
jgi:putative intracellular protease/amidase